MNKQNMVINIANIVAVENSRLPNMLSLDTLMDDIAANGLKECPIVAVSENVPDGMFEQVTGHRRVAAINLLQDDSPARFAELFPNGDIEVTVLSDATHEDIVMAKVDQGNQKTLTHKMELQKASNMLFSVGMTEADVAVSMAGLLDSMFPLAKKNSDEQKLLKTGISFETREGHHGEAEELRKQLRKHILDCRRGIVQGLHNTYRAPDLVFAARWYHASDEKLEAVEALDFIPKLTVGQSTGLWKAFSKDLKIMEDGKRAYSKGRPGPQFWNKWNKLVSDQKAAEKAPEVTRDKAMSSKAMKAEVTDGKWDSNGFNEITKHHSGAEVTGLNEVDHLLATAELVSKLDPDLWGLVEDSAKLIRKEQLEADQAAAESEKDA